jgi:spore coat polysaccharide biosynthesis protein SpsF (cytidylyltransferase family)
MKNAGIIIQANLTSSRFPSKTIYPLLGKTVIERIIDTCIETDLPVCVAIPQNKTDQGLKYFIEQNYENIPVIVGHKDDLMLRFIQANKEMKFNPIVRICADSPFVSVRDIRLALQIYKKRMYYTRLNNVEVFGMNELLWYEKNVPLITQREHCLGVVGLSTVDYPEDIDRLEKEWNCGSPTMDQKRRWL